MKISRQDAKAQRVSVRVFLLVLVFLAVLASLREKLFAFAPPAALDESSLKGAER
jgi:hypothetical protein